MKSHAFSLPVSPADLTAIVLSHGWYKLAPWCVEVSPPRLVIPFDLPQGHGCFTVAAAADGLYVTVNDGPADLCRTVAEACLSLDINCTPIHSVAQSTSWAWLVERHLGRFLRSPSLFEDCIKIVFAMNTTFRRTKQMTESLVAAYGRPVGGLRAFPTPEAVLAAGESGIREATRCGYRTPYLLHLAAEAVAQPEIYQGTAWRAFTPEEFTTTLARVPGMGPVSTGYITRMYGKPCGYAVDSYVRRRCRELWGIDAGAVDNFVADRYAEFGQLGPTVFWFELTRHWHEDAA